MKICVWEKNSHRIKKRHERKYRCQRVFFFSHLSRIYPPPLQSRHPSFDTHSQHYRTELTQMWQPHLNISVQAGCISIQTEKVAVSLAWPTRMEHHGSVWLQKERL